MFSDFKQLNIHRNGCFSKSWLAATSPSIFRRKFSKYQVQQIKVNNVCNDILKVWNTDFDKLQSRMSLFIATQLMYGTVCIYKQQIHQLYEDTNNFLIGGAYTLSNLIFKRKILDDDQNYPEKNIKRRKHIKFLEENSQKNDIIIFDNELDNECITIREADIIFNQHINDDGFLQITEEELKEINLLIDDGRSVLDDFESIFAETYKESEYPFISNDQYTLFDTQNTANTSIENIGNKKNVSNINDTINCIVPITNNRNHLINNEVRNESQNATIYNKINVNEHSLMMNLVDMRSGDRPLQNKIVNDTLPISQLLKNNTHQSSRFDTEILEHITDFQSKVKRKRTKKHLIRDQVRRINDDHFYEQIINYSSTMRSEPPSTDIVTFRDQQFRIDFFGMPSHKILFSPFQEYFRRNISAIKKNVTLNDETILLEILSLPVLNSNRSKISNKILTEKPIEEIIIENQNRGYPEIDRNISELEIEANRLIEQSESILLNIEIPINELENELESTIKQNMTEIDKKYYNERILSHSHWGNRAIFKKLVSLWVSNKYPIQMKNVCPINQKRKHAAIAFQSLLVLNKDKFINLKKKNGFLEIFHIEKGSKLLDLNNN